MRGYQTHLAAQGLRDLATIFARAVKDRFDRTFGKETTASPAKADDAEYGLEVIEDKMSSPTEGPIPHIRHNGGL
jgi:hypothetical protein